MTQKFRMKKALIAVLLTVSMLGALVAPAAVASAQTNGPDGMVALGAGQVFEDLPAGADAPLSADDLRGNVYASDHADTLSVTLTTAERAADRVGDNANVLAGDEWALVLSDDQVHAGRDVAISADVLDHALGYKPNAVFGVHSSGDDWSSEVDYQGGHGVFAVERFSDNAVTFSGSITLNGDSASDGSQFSYELDSNNGVDNFIVNLTGVSNSQDQLVSGTISGSGSRTISPGGTSATDATVDLLGVDDSAYLGTLHYVSSGSRTTTFEPPHGTVSKIGFRDDQDLSFSYDVVTPSGTISTGASTTFRNFTGSAAQFEVTGPIDFTVENIDGAAEVEDLTLYYESGETLTVDGSSYSDTGSVTLPITAGSDTAIDFTNVDGQLSYNISWSETTKTVDPEVAVNGQRASHSGSLSDGQTTTLSVDSSWIQSGQNNVSISLSDPSDGPGALVDMSYRHDTSGTSQATTVDSTTWQESINVSRTFPNSQKDVTSTLSFSENAVNVGDIEVKTNSGDWQHPNSWEMSGSDLTVELGDVNADDTVQVRAEGRKVRVVDGSIDITDPTVEGDKLDTQIEITGIASSGEFGIEVGNTVNDRLHYAGDKSFSGSTYAQFDASGGQTLRAPEASVGSTMTVNTAPLSISPESGEIEAVIDDPNEPRFSLRQGDTIGSATVGVTYYDTISGERYVLWDVAEEREVDADRAQSPVSFTTGGSSTTYTIQQRDRTGSSTTGVAPLQSGGGAPLILIVPAVGISVMGLFWAGRRFGGATGVRGNAILLLGSAVVTVVAVELITPRSLASDLIFALTDLLSAGAGAVIVFSGLMLSLWAIQTRTRADVPWWIYVTVAPTGVIMTMETIRPGSVLGAIESVLMEAGVLVVLFLMGLIVWRLRQNQEARTTPDTQITVQGFRDNDK